MLQHFLDLLRYDLWANHRSLDSLEPLGAAGDKGKLLIAHIASAKFNWRDRIEGRALRQGFFPEWTFAECRAKHDQAHAEWNEYLAGMSDADLLRPITYRNLKGIEATRTLQQILVQLTLHGPHHRGQVASIVRAAGFEPASTDYILYVK